MTVSYQVVGEQLVMQADGSVKSFRNGVYTGAFDPPNFIFTQGGTQQSIQLAVSPFGAHPVQVDSGTTWSVDANPLLHAVDNLNGTVQWYSSQQLTGTASETTIIFIYTPQYYLTTSTDGDGGSVSPASGWYDAWTVVPITANADSSYMFQSWTGTNDGSYTGTDNPSSVTMNGPVTQQATFAFVIPENALLLIPFAIIIVVVLKRRKSRQSTPYTKSGGWFYDQT
jgi:hypothetical protein